MAMENELSGFRHEYLVNYLIAQMSFQCFLQICKMINTSSRMFHRRFLYLLLWFSTVIDPSNQSYQDSISNGALVVCTL